MVNFIKENKHEAFMILAHAPLAAALAVKDSSPYLFTMYLMFAISSYGWARERNKR